MSAPRKRLSLRVPLDLWRDIHAYVDKEVHGYGSINDLLLDVLRGGLARAPQVRRWCGRQVRALGDIRAVLYRVYRHFKNEAVGRKSGKYKPAIDPIWDKPKPMSDAELMAWVMADCRNGLPEIKRLRQQVNDLQRNSIDGWHIVFELLKTMKWTSARMVKALANLGYTQTNGYRDGISDHELEKCQRLLDTHSAKFKNSRRAHDRPQNALRIAV